MPYALDRIVVRLATAIAILTTALATAGEPRAGVADLDIAELVNVRVSPFDVSVHRDTGYRASNSVSASRFDAPLGDLPFAVQAFTESFIADQKPRDIFDVARYAPGVTYRSNDFNEGNANLAIRGFTVGSIGGGNVQVLRDGFHGPSIFDFTNVSRLEVVKGPASFLYGQLAPGGVVNVITKSPQSRYAATAEAAYGSYGEYRIAGDVTGPATPTLFYRLAASYDEDMHYWEPYDAHSWDLAPTVLWQPNERVSVTLKYEHFRKDESPQLMQKPGYNVQTGLFPTAADPNLSGVDVPGLPDDWNSMSDRDYRRSETSNPSAWIDFRAGEHWNLRTGFSHLEYTVDALASGNFGMSDNATFLQGRRFRFQDYSNREDSVQTDAVGRYAIGATSLRLLFGAQYVDRTFERHAGQAPNDPALGNVPVGSPLPRWDLRDPATWSRSVGIPRSALTVNPIDQTVRYDDASVYGGATVGLHEDRLLLLAGWRWTGTDSRLTDLHAASPHHDGSASVVTPQYGVLVKPLPGISLYASYAESFVPGTLPVDHPDGTSSVAKPTEGQGYEAGIKAELLGGRLSGTLTYFDITNRNIVNDLALTNATGIVRIYGFQSGEQRSQGLELDTTATLAEHWQLYLSYSWMDARITEFSGRDAALLAQDPNGLDAAGRANYRDVLRFHDAPLQMSAPHLANLWTRYDFTQDRLRGLFVGGGFNFVYDQTILPDTPVSAHQTYTLFNATIGYGWQVDGHRLSIDLTGRNLADEDYRPSQSTRGRPREILATFKVSF